VRRVELGREKKLDLLGSQLDAAEAKAALGIFWEGNVLWGQNEDSIVRRGTSFENSQGGGGRQKKMERAVLN